MKNDWLEEVKATAELESINLGELREGDQISVQTKNSRYNLIILDAENRKVRMTSSRAQSPEGEMTLMGCALGTGSSLSPDKLFCGGYLELNFQAENGEPFTHTTSAIQAIHLLQT